MQTSNTSIFDYQRLYEAAALFKRGEFWNHMYDSELFGVRNPETKEIGYCHVMGRLGEFFALAVHLGAEGLDGLRQMRIVQEKQDERGKRVPTNVLEYQRCLMASFESRQDQQKEDIAIIKKLKLKFRGPYSWPLFRCFVPNCFPWFLSSDQVKFLTIALEQAIDVCSRYKENSNLLLHPSGNLDFCLVRTVDNGTWEDSWVCLEKYKPKKIVPFVDSDLMTKMKWQNLPRQGVVITDSFLLSVHFPENKEEPPRCPYLIPFISPEGLVIDFNLTDEDLHICFPKSFLNSCIKSQQIPELVLVSSERAYSLLSPLAETFSFTIQQEENLPQLDHFMNDFEQNFFNRLR